MGHNNYNFLSSSMNYKNCGDNLPELVATFHIGIDGVGPEAKFLGDFQA